MADLHLAAEPGLDALFDASPSALVLLEPNGSIRRANRGFADWLGAGFVELRKRNWWNLLHAADLGPALLSFSQLVSGQAGEQIEFAARFATAPESTRWGLVRCTLVNAGTVVFAQIADQTPWREAQAQAVAMRARIAQLEQECSALRSVLMVAAEGLSEEARGTSVEMVHALCRSASMPLKMEGCSLDDLVRRVIKSIDKGCGARLWSLADLPVVHGAVEILEQVFTELLSGAGRAVAPGARPAVAIGSYLEDHIPVIFVRYQNGNNDDKRSSEFPSRSAWAGWRTAILRHGGTSWIERDDDGQTTICFSLEPLPGRA